MSKGLEITYTRPSTDVPWWTDFLAAQTDPAFDDLKESYQRVLAIVDPEGTGVLKRRIIDDPAQPLVRKLQWSMSEMPGDYTLEQAILYHRKLIKRELHENINDHSIIESAEISFDGIPRTYARCLVWDWRISYDETNGIVNSANEIKDFDF